MSRVNNFPSFGMSTQRSRFYPVRNYDALIKNYHPPTTKEALTYLLLSLSFSHLSSLRSRQLFIYSLLRGLSPKAKQAVVVRPAKKKLSRRIKSSSSTRRHKFSPKGVAWYSNKHRGMSIRKEEVTMKFHKLCNLTKIYQQNYI